MKDIPVVLEGNFVGTKVERYGEKDSTLGMFLVGVESVPFFIPNGLKETVEAYPKMAAGAIKATVTFRDQKPGGYFVLKEFIYDTPPADKAKK